MKNVFQSNDVQTCQNKIKLSYVCFYLNYHRGKLSDDKRYFCYNKKICKLRNLARKLFSQGKYSGLINKYILNVIIVRGFIFI